GIFLSEWGKNYLVPGSNKHGFAHLEHAFTATEDSMIFSLVWAKIIACQTQPNRVGSGGFCWRLWQYSSSVPWAWSITSIRHMNPSYATGWSGRCLKPCRSTSGRLP